MTMRRKWWRTRSREVVVKALLPHLSVHESREATEDIFDALEAKGLRIVRDHAAPAPAPFVSVGLGPFRLPGERRAWRQAEQRARDMLDSISEDRTDG